MTRAKFLIAGAVTVTAGFGLGLSSAYLEAERGSAPEVLAAHFMLAPAAAVQPVDTTSAPEEAAEPAVRKTLTGSASFYANSLSGRRTASGVPYNPREMVAAHQTLPFGSLLRVTNEANGKTVTVRVVDRGPFARGRVLDLSRIAAEKLDFIRRGHTRVTIEVLEDTEDHVGDS